MSVLFVDFYMAVAYCASLPESVDENVDGCGGCLSFVVGR